MVYCSASRAMRPEARTKTRTTKMNNYDDSNEVINLNRVATLTTLFTVVMTLWVFFANA